MATDDSTPKASLIKWLLDADPAIRWQVMRDLTDAPPDVIAAERARVGQESWGAQILAQQEPKGHWGGELDKETWMCTNYMLDLLRVLGLDPAGEEARAAVERVRENITWHQLGGQPYFEGETEACINGRILATGAYFGQECDVLLARLLSEQLEDGGWNCEAPTSRRSSFHSTICVLEGLLEYERAHGPQPATTAARTRAEEYLLSRRLFRSLSTGEVINPKWLRFSFPPIWNYNVLRGLDYFRAAGHPPEARMAEAVQIVKKRQHQNGRWPVVMPPDDRYHFPMEGLRGTASRWNTLRGLRVLRWARDLF